MPPGSVSRCGCIARPTLPNCSGGLTVSKQPKAYPYGSLVSATESERVDVARSFPVGGGDSQRRPTIEQDRSKVLVLSTDDSTGGDAVRCGEVMSTVLLECTMAGMATCTLINVTESPAGRDVFAALIGPPSMGRRLRPAPRAW